MKRYFLVISGINPLDFLYTIGVGELTPAVDTIEEITPGDTTSQDAATQDSTTTQDTASQDAATQDSTTTQDTASQDTVTQDSATAQD